MGLLRRSNDNGTVAFGRRCALLGALVSSFWLSGCDGCGAKGDQAPRPAASAAASAPTASPGGSANAHPAASASAESPPLFGRMALEAKNRPQVTPNVDDAFAAFSKAGVTVGDLEQSLGQTYKAGYCKHGLTAEKDVAVLVCEYQTPELAAAGLLVAQATFPGITRRHSYMHKSLLLAIMPQDPASPPDAVAKATKVVAAFNAL